jgi:peptidoglycan/LPS O-acetylase OafA/YrhL
MPEPVDRRPLSQLHFPALDGLRGIAVLLVMFHHFVRELTPTSRLAQFAQQVLGKGWVGVDIFFALSGFLITGILLDGKERGVPLRVFYARRALRIFPLYYFALLFSLAIAAIDKGVFGPAAQGGSIPHMVWLWTYLSNLPRSFQQLGEPLHRWLNLGHFWSLAIEEQFYLVWPWLVMGLSTRTFLMAALACLPLSVLAKLLLLKVGISPINADYFTFVRMAGLCAGAVVAVLVRDRGLATLRRLATSGLVAVIGVSLLLVAVRQRALWVTVLGNHLLLSVAFSSIVAIVVSTPSTSRINRVLGSTVLSWFGVRSYGLYVWHCLLQRPMVAGLHVLGIVPVTGLAQIELMTALLGLSCLAATLSWHLIERPFLKMRSRFKYQALKS